MRLGAGEELAESRWRLGIDAKTDMVEGIALPPDGFEGYVAVHRPGEFAIAINQVSPIAINRVQARQERIGAPRRIPNSPTFLFEVDADRVANEFHGVGQRKIRRHNADRRVEKDRFGRAVGREDFEKDGVPTLVQLDLLRSERPGLDRHRGTGQQKDEQDERPGARRATPAAGPRRLLRSWSDYR